LSTGQMIDKQVAGEITFGTRDFYLACFLRCIGYELIDLRAEGRRKVFVFRDRPTRRNDVLAFYADGAAVPPLMFSTTIKDMKALLYNA
jgi:hypothetical protein